MGLGYPVGKVSEDLLKPGRLSCMRPQCALAALLEHILEGERGQTLLEDSTNRLYRSVVTIVLADIGKGRPLDRC